MGLQLVTVHLDPDLPLPAPQNTGFGYAVLPLQRRSDLPPGHSPKLGQIRASFRSNQSQRKHRRLSGVETAHQHFFQIRIGAQQAHRFFDVHQGEIHVGVPLEGDGGDQTACSGDLFNGADTPNGEQQLFYPFTIDPFHFFRWPVTGTGGYHDSRTLNIRKEIQGHVAPGDPSQDRHGGGEHSHRYRSIGGHA